MRGVICEVWSAMVSKRELYHLRAFQNHEAFKWSLEHYSGGALNELEGFPTDQQGALWPPLRALSVYFM